MHGAWEYRRILLNEVPRRADEVDLLNQVGKEGWELVNITTNNIAYLKRLVGGMPVTAGARRKATAG